MKILHLNFHRRVLNTESERMQVVKIFCGSYGMVFPILHNFWSLCWAVEQLDLSPVTVEAEKVFGEWAIECQSSLC